jgi:hypothetical protein
MQMLFINLTSTQVYFLVAISFILVLYAAILALKREKGLTQILWLLGIIFLPPFFAIFYLLKTHLFKDSFGEKGKKKVFS